MPHGAPETTAASVRVLVVDQDPLVRRVVRDALAGGRGRWSRTDARRSAACA
jgi:hypothetical protein